MSYAEIAQKWKGRKNGRRIAVLMLLNSKGRMKAQKRTRPLS